MFGDGLFQRALLLRHGGGIVIDGEDGSGQTDPEVDGRARMIGASIVFFRWSDATRSSYSGGGGV